MSIAGTIHRIDQAKNTQAAVQIIDELFEHNYTTLQLITNPHQMLDNLFVRSTYPKEWIAEYLLNNFLKVDPVFNQIIKAKENVLWSEVPWTSKASKFYERAKRFGIGESGYSFVYKDAIGIGSILSLNAEMDRENWSRYVTEITPTIEELIPVLHNKIASEAYSTSIKSPQLTSREKECLHYSSIGKTNFEIGAILSISEHTVRSYIKTVRHKLDCVSVAQAVAKAIRFRII